MSKTTGETHTTTLGWQFLSNRRHIDWLDAELQRVKAQVAVPEKYPHELKEVLADAAGALRALADYLNNNSPTCPVGGDDIARLAERCAAFAGVK